MKFSLKKREIRKNYWVARSTADVYENEQFVFSNSYIPTVFRVGDDKMVMKDAADHLIWVKAKIRHFVDNGHPWTDE